MITFIFIILGFIIMLCAHSEKYLIFAVILSILWLFGIISYDIYTGYYHPFNDLTTYEIKQNRSKYINQEKRLEFVSVNDIKVVKFNKKKNRYLVKFKLFNGEIFWGDLSIEQQNKVEKECIITWAWLSPKTYNYLNINKNTEIKSFTHCKLKIEPKFTFLTDFSLPSTSWSVFRSPYLLIYKITNTFLSQKISGAIGLIAQIMVLIFVLFLMFTGQIFMGIGD